MSTIIAALALAAPLASTANLPELFVAACLDGKASLPKGEARPVPIDELPRVLRDQLGNPASGQAWRLASTGQAYLYLLNYDPGADETKICGVASDSMNVAAAADAVEMRMAGYAGAERLQGMQWLMPQDGYVTTLTRAGELRILQINWLSERARGELLKQVRRVTP